MSLTRAALLALALGALHCGGSAPPPEAPSPRPRAAAPAAQAQPAPVETRPRGTLYRDEVVATVDAGLGRFLQKVEVEPSLKDGRFQGFRIVALRPSQFWTGVDLAPGDVVTSVNGMPIERDTQAYDAFVALKTSERLRVSYLRKGAPRELEFRIVERAR